MAITVIDELEMLKKENAALKEELRQMKNHLAFEERRKRELSRTADKLRELKAKLKELAE